MARRKKRVRFLGFIYNFDFLKFAVVTILIGIVVLAILAPPALSQFEEKLGIKISNYIDYEKYFNSKTSYYAKRLNIEIIPKTDLTIDNEKLNIYCLYVGQADCSLVVYNGKTMLIDSGNKEDGDKVIGAIRALGIDKLDIVIGTHAHEDHIGSMYQIVEKFDIGEIYLPYNDTNTNSYYKKLLKAIQAKNLKISSAEIGENINMDNDLDIKIMSVDNNNPEDTNDASICIQINYKTQKFLFMGDATTAVEDKRNWEDVDVLRVGHHGSNSSTSERFLEQTRPEISIISVGLDNSYGLPKNKILKRLNKSGSNVYRTDLDGTIQLVSDGNQNEIFKIDESFDGN